MSTPSGPRAIFGTGKRDVPGVLFRAQAMHDAIVAAAATFASPTITMAEFLILITALAAAQQYAVAMKAPGSAAARDAKRNLVWTAMESLRTYVQGLCDVLSADAAIALIEAGGLRVAATPVHTKPLLAATLTTTPGLVHLSANASLLVGPENSHKQATFHWQWSADGGQTWNSVISTPHARTDVPGLALLGTYSFRVSVTVGKVPGAWSQAISLLVH
jgi:hypothetical protein